MKRRTETFLVFSLASAIALAACKSGGGESTGVDQGAADALAQMSAQDRAWGFVRRHDASANHFLVENGAGDLDESNAYYASVVPNFTPDTYTLSTWQQETLGSAATYTAFYRNRVELGFWRQMTCTQVIRRGVGGCMVTNWENETDPANGLPNKGTVAMSVSALGFTQFYVFLPTGVLSPTALLDSEGPKFLPRICTVCHSGFNLDPGNRADLGSVFREFLVSELDAQSGLSQADAELQWFNLNQAIRTANESIRGESEGAPTGTDHAKAEMGAFLDAYYPNLAPPARGLSDPALTPVSWQGGTPKTTLWTNLVAPYCMACHRHNSDDWSNYANFSFLRAKQGGVGLLRQYTTVIDGAHPLAYMPQSELAFNTVATDTAANAAIDGWLATCSSGKACVPIANPCHKGKTKCVSGEATCTDTGASLADGTTCGSHLICAKGACVPDATCHPSVLVLGDGAAGDASNASLVQALTSSGLTATLLDSGTTTYDGTLAANSFGAILVTPGRTYDTDMPAAGQQAIVAANTAGTGVVFTEWSAYQVTESRYTTLGPLMLLGRTGGQTSTGTFTLTATGHPIWTGLPASFTTLNSLGFSTGAATNGGTAIAGVVANGVSGDGVIVKEAPGRLVHLAHAGSYNANPWGTDTNTTLLMTNAVRWAARCL